MAWWSVSVAHRKPPEVRMGRVSISSGVDAPKGQICTTALHQEQSISGNSHRRSLQMPFRAVPAHSPAVEQGAVCRGAVLCITTVNAWRTAPPALQRSLSPIGLPSRPTRALQRPNCSAGSSMRHTCSPRGVRKAWSTSWTRGNGRLAATCWCTGGEKLGVHERTPCARVLFVLYAWRVLM
jgi:hypothetical protein